MDSAGRILAIGEADHDGTSSMVLARYETDGLLDESFGSGGMVVESWCEGAGGAAAQAQPDGKIVAAGYARKHGTGVFAVVRYNPDGTPDQSFGGDGVVLTAIGESAGATDVVVQPDGKIVAAGYARRHGTGVFAVVRYNSDGTPDTSLGTTGIVTTKVGAYASAESILLQADGKLVVFGYAYKRGRGVFALVRYQAGGTLDGSFGDGGRVTTRLGSFALPGAALLQPDGKIVAAGFAARGSEPGMFTVVRYESSGDLDSSFGVQGISMTRVGKQGSVGDVLIQPDGKLIVVGSAAVGGVERFALIRLESGGSFDPSFGKVTTRIGRASEAVAGTLQPDGKVVLGGTAFVDKRAVLALARYLTV